MKMGRQDKTIQRGNKVGNERLIDKERRVDKKGQVLRE